MSFAGDERRPPGQEQAPHGEWENKSPVAESVAPDPRPLNGAPQSLRPAFFIAPTRASVPPELQAIDHWVSWRYELRVDKKSGKPKPTKIPIDPLTGANAKSNTRTTWGSFEQAWSRYESDALDGIGFVLTLDAGIVGIDIDHCREPKTGAIDDEGLAIVRELDSYTEVSPSGTGIRIFARGKLPNGWRKRGRVEMYDRARYLTVTGVQVEVQ